MAAIQTQLRLRPSLRLRRRKEEHRRIYHYPDPTEHRLPSQSQCELHVSEYARQTMNPVGPDPC